MSNDHFHYASEIHGGAEEHHRHYDLEDADRDLRSDVAELARNLQHQLADVRNLLAEITAAAETCRDLHKTSGQWQEACGEVLGSLRNRVYALERNTPDARRLQYEADQALADLPMDER